MIFILFRWLLEVREPGYFKQYWGWHWLPLLHISLGVLLLEWGRGFPVLEHGGLLH
ncbi:Uncharacterised protein [Serratia marcescens]|nr:Uncharacterised protein [Serratia marcescens]CUY19037.1 Uncharacterised protein [Serratia marcescens]CUZ38648.1 Uncharacterised protein [Serratia marcescens]CUZ69843.1 Uncharacterised protein [Serratia marcescens]CVB42340.1 Uncharacterised protein [Serratia marcescens]